ncbi:DoxX family protein [Methylotuvimicrobium sp. KM1]|uniref:HvfX family Cu-binding RiPP maturation protein n=1 Tax=Methylotuvimicrobium sp. KM1 TaxID=3377707 RepID=UPI00384E175E
MKNESLGQTEADSTQLGTHGICGVMFGKLAGVYLKSTDFLNRNTDGLPPLLLRLVLAYEFWEAGVMKYQGENWFDNLKFPFPFDLLSNDLLWLMGTWFEIIGAIALILGFATRFFSLSLMILTVVAINTVHWPAEWNTLSELWKGYSISNKGFGNYKLPLLYLLMFLPLLFGGAGKWSLDHAIKRVFCRTV